MVSLSRCQSSEMTCGSFLAVLINLAALHAFYSELRMQHDNR
jgi:hypothetical protein